MKISLLAVTVVVAATPLWATVAPSAHAVATVTTVTTPPATGTQVAHNLHGYPYAAAPDCTEAMGSMTGCVPDAWRFFQGQCVSWVAYRLNSMSGIPMDSISYRGQRWGYASNWVSAARRAGIPTNSAPARGAVAVWTRGAGHVAYVERVNADGSVMVSEMNHDAHNGFAVTRIARSDRWPAAFIHFRDLPNAALTYQVTQGGTLVSTLTSYANPSLTTRRVANSHDFSGMRLVTTVQDVTGDGWPDLLAVSKSSGTLFLYRSRGDATVGVWVPLGVNLTGAGSLIDAGQARGAASHVVQATFTDGHRSSWSIVGGVLSARVDG